MSPKPTKSGKILEDGTGKRYFLPNGDSETLPGRIVLPVLDEHNEPKTDGHGRSMVKIFNSIELLQSIREKKMKIIGFVD